MNAPMRSLQIQDVELLRALAELQAKQRHLEQSKAEWIRVFDAIGHMVFVHDAEFRIVLANRAYLERAGLDRLEVIGRPYWTVFPLRDGPFSSCRAKLREGSKYHRPEADSFSLDSGEQFLSRGFSVYDDDGAFVESVHVIEDVTEQHRTDIHQRALSEAMRQSNEAIVILGANGLISYANPSFFRVFGYAPEAVLGKHVAMLAAPGQSTELQPDRLLDRLREKGQWQGEVQRLGKDGTPLTVALSASIVYDEHGEVSAYVGAFHDLRPMKQAQNALSHSEARFRLLTENASDIVAILAPEGTFLYFSGSGERLLGYAPGEIMHLTMFDLTHPDDLPQAQGVIQRLLEERTDVQTLTHRVRHKDGSWRWFESTARNLVHEPAVAGLVVNSRDVTEREKANESLQRVNRALLALSTANQVLVRANGEAQLLHEMCDLLVGTGGYHSAWIGYPGDERERCLHIAAQASRGAPIPENTVIPLTDDEASQHPASRAMGTGKVQVFQNVETEPGLAPWREEILAAGIRSGVALPLNSDTQTFGLLHVFSDQIDVFVPDELILLSELADDAAYGVITLRTHIEHDRLQHEALQHAEHMRNLLIETIRAISLTVDKRDPYTAGHQQRVAALAGAIAREMGLDPDQIEGIRLGATIHDIGQIYVPAEILNRPGKLDKFEMDMIKSHPEVGYDIVKDVKFPWPVAQMILQHHERLDGSGYPRGLRGDEIIPEARILAVADVVEAITSHRPYRPAYSIEEGLEEIMNHRGSLYDPVVVDVCVMLFQSHRFEFDTAAGSDAANA